MNDRLSARDVCLIGLGGAIGSLLRYLIGDGYAGAFPIPTVFVNISGTCLLAALYANQHNLHPGRRHFYMVGFCGSFTTVSLFSHENWRFLQDGNLPFLALNLAVPVFSAAALGWILIHFLERSAADPPA